MLETLAIIFAAPATALTAVLFILSIITLFLIACFMGIPVLFCLWIMYLISCWKNKFKKWKKC